MLQSLHALRKQGDAEVRAARLCEIVGQPQAEGAGDGTLAPAGLLREVALAEAEGARPVASVPDPQPPGARALGDAEAQTVARRLLHM